jgi:hypothetical protein
VIERSIQLYEGKRPLSKGIASLYQGFDALRSGRSIENGASLSNVEALGRGGVLAVSRSIYPM